MDLSAIGEPPPRYCPRCARGTAHDETVCRTCGGQTEPRGYCDVCESYRLAGVGESCVKHDLILETGPAPSPMALSDGTAIQWTTLARFDSMTAAEGPRLRLFSEGIPVFLDGERMVSGVMNPPAIGGVKLQVPASLLDDARVLLDQIWELPGDELDDAWDELGPQPGARRQAVMRWAIVVILGLPLLVPVARLLLELLAAAGRR